MNRVLAGLVVGTLVMGGACAWALARYGQRVAPRLWPVALLLALTSLLLLAPAAQGVSGRVTWITGLEPMALRSEPPSNYLAVQVFWALLIAQFIGRARAFAPARAWETLLIYLLCALAVAALTVDSFLARVILLDMLSLLTTGALWFAMASDSPGATLWRRYLVFRLGDLALMGMVLWLSISEGTLKIDALLSAAVSLASSSARWIMLLGVAAAWIKLGLPPFHGWVGDAWRLHRSTRALALGVALPLLGAYLLYRMEPALLAGGMRGVLVGSGIAAGLWGALGPKHSATTGLPRWPIVHAALAPLLVGTGGLPLYVLTFAPLRVALCLLLALERRPIALRAAAQHEPGFDSGLAGVVLGLAGRCERVIESGLFEGVLDGLVSGVRALSWAAQRLHSGRLRRNVAWALSALLAMALVAAFWFAY
jgi:hypothetical protein